MGIKSVLAQRARSSPEKFKHWITDENTPEQARESVDAGTWAKPPKLR